MSINDNSGMGGLASPKCLQVVLVVSDSVWAGQLKEWVMNFDPFRSPQVRSCAPDDLQVVLSQGRPDVLVWDCTSAGPYSPADDAITTAIEYPVLVLESISDSRIAPTASIHRESLNEQAFLRMLRTLLPEPVSPEIASAAVPGPCFQTAFDQSPAGLALVLADGRLICANAALAELLGYPLEELRDKRDYDILHPDDLPVWRSRLSNASSSPSRLLRMEARLLHCTGGAIWSEICARLIAGNEAYPPHFVIEFLDIRSRRESEEALRSSEQWFRALVEHSSDAVVLVGKNGRIRYASDSIARILGYTPGELVGREGQTLLHPAELAENSAFFANVFRARRRVSFGAFRVLHRQGGWRWLEGAVTNQLNDPCVRGIVFNLRDITERKRATQILQRQALIVANLSDAILVTDKSGRIIECNPAAFRLFGRDRGDLIGRTAAIVHSDEQLRRIGQVIGPRQDQDGRCTAEIGFIRNDGAAGICELTIVPVRDRRGDFIGTIHVYHDISERKQAELERAQSERRYRELFENANDVIFCTDFSGNITKANPSAELAFNRTADELLHANLADLLTDDSRQRFLNVLRRMKQGELSPPLEIEVVKSARERLTLEVNPQLLFEAGEPLGMQAIARDVTERKELEAQLRQAQKMEALGRLAGGVAHDFNNLLTVIGGYGEYLQEELPPEDRLREATREIVRAVERAGGLTRQMLAFSRQQVLRPVALQLNESLESATSLLRRIIGEDIELVVETDSGLHPIRADRNQIEQVLLNLAVNARDAMPNGGRLTLRYGNVSLPEPRRLVDSWMPKGDYVALSVSDTGIGMDAELIGKIFEPFFTTKGEKGTGLGLSTVHGIVRQSQGYIHVESVQGEGTTFTIYFQRANQPIESNKSAEPGHNRDCGSETILVVEDQEDVRSFMLHLLRTRGYSVLSADCGDDAMRVCREHRMPIHLLITDMLMPGLPVEKLVDEARIVHRGMRVLYISGYAHGDSLPADSVDWLRENAFLPKPFHPNELLQQVRTLLDRCTLHA